MFDRILPTSIDNTYSGHKLALWFFGLLALMRSVIGFNSIFNGREVLKNADGIPLDSYPAGAAHSIVALWALLGLSYVFIGALCVIVLVRYRSMVPFMFVLLLVQHLIGRAILEFHPIDRIGAPPASMINLVFVTLMIIGLALSLWRRR